MQPEQNPDQQGPKQSDIAHKAAQQRRPVFDPMGRVESLTSNEVLVADVRRHPFGLVMIWIGIITALTLALAMIFIFLPSVIEVIGVSASDANSAAAGFAFFTIVFGILFLAIVTRIYLGNQLIVSDKNVTQVLQLGLFNRKISELSMANVEDVTAEQNGIFSTIFNYGTLRIETAGEQNNFIFIYCPNPNAYAKAILDSRLNFISNNGAHH